MGVRSGGQSGVLKDLAFLQESFGEDHLVDHQGDLTERVFL